MVDSKEGFITTLHHQDKTGKFINIGDFLKLEEWQLPSEEERGIHYDEIRVVCIIDDMVCVRSIKDPECRCSIDMVNFELCEII